MLQKQDTGYDSFVRPVVSRLWDGGSIVTLTQGNYYASTHGGTLTVTAPAPAGAAPTGSGARPQARFEYAQFQARYMNVTGAWINGAPVWRPTKQAACATEAPGCIGTADEAVTTFTYPSASTPNNLLPTYAQFQARYMDHGLHGGLDQRRARLAAHQAGPLRDGGTGLHRHRQRSGNHLRLPDRKHAQQPAANLVLRPNPLTEWGSRNVHG